MWLKYLMDTKQAKLGEVVQVADGGEASAKALIEAGIGEEVPEPETAKKAAQEAAIGVSTLIEKAVAKGFNDLTKTLEPSLKKFRQVVDDEHSYTTGTQKALKLPATAKRYSTTRNFTGPDKDAKAYYFGCMAMAVRGHSVSRKRLDEAGIRLTPFIDADNGPIFFTDANGNVETKAASELNNADSAYLVPPQFGDDIIDLREQYGVFRRYAKIVPMSSDTRTDPKRRDGVATYFVGEGTAGTQADKTWGQVTLTAKKLMALTKYSSEISEDAMINMGDDLAAEMAYGFALKEDQCGFIGDGSSTYGGMQGVTTRLKAVSGTIANIKGLVVASGTGYATSYGSIVLGDFNSVVGILPEYAEQRDPNCAWYCSKFFWGSVMQRLATAAGGNRVENIQGGSREKMFLGYPVIISQVMPKTSAVSQVACLFGSLKLSTSFGTRREIGIATSNAALNAFEQDQLVMRGTERFHINVHDVGDGSTADSTQAGTVAGPIVGLITAAS